MEEIKTSSTSESLLEILKVVLKRYNIKMDQNYTMTTDNRRNMIKCSRLILELQSEIENQNSAADATFSSAYVSDSEGEDADDVVLLGEPKIDDLLQELQTCSTCVAGNQQNIKNFTSSAFGK